ncbi:MAG: hypothetical protein IJY04_05220 [Clostridia bacterium]|nr:hypothetical protein [Clostridia bacterium]
MKKIITRTLSLALILMLLCLAITSCNFTQTSSGGASDKAETAAKVEEMLTALIERNDSSAKALLHPQASDKTDTAITQMSVYLNGRSASSVELLNFNVRSSFGTSGKTRQEQSSYQVTLTDGDIIYLNTVYLSDSAGDGFVSFQLVLGLV